MYKVQITAFYIRALKFTFSNYVFTLKFAAIYRRLIFSAIEDFFQQNIQRIFFSIKKVTKENFFSKIRWYIEFWDNPNLLKKISNFKVILHPFGPFIISYL